MQHIYFQIRRDCKDGRDCQIPGPDIALPETKKDEQQRGIGAHKTGSL